MQVSERVKGIAASQSLAMAARAKAMKAAGVDVISMSLGEPDMDTPEHIRRAAQEAIDKGWTHYGPVAGVASLRTAVAAAQNANCRLQIDDCKFDASDVIVSVGAKMAIYNAIQTVVNPGDEVVIPMPSWVSYTEIVKLAGGKVVAIQTKYENRYCLTADELRAALTEKTRMLILCSPNNPTGSIYSHSQLKALVEVLREFPQVTVLSDEIYDALVYDEYINIDKHSNAAINPKKKNAESTVADCDIRVTTNQPAHEQAPGQVACEFRIAGTDTQSPQDSLQKCAIASENDKNNICSLAEFGELAERLIIVNGVSKAYAMTGWRIGWLMSKNKAFIEACARLQGQQVTCATMVAQKAAEAALIGSQDCVEAMRQVFAERRELICKLAAEIPGWKFEKPQGAFYLFPDVSALGGGDRVAEFLLEEAHVAVVSGSAFGCPDCIRLSYAISTEEIIEAMRRIKVAIEKLI
jgi:aspartate/methionine/tyrosine aminotransferase